MSKILAIDDKPDNLVTLSALLNNLMPGCAVITAQSGIKGIEKARSELPDSILLDVRMPDVDGFETCRRLKSDESTKHIPVIMITAIKTDPQSRIKGLEIGADAFLAKPIDPYELASQVKVALRIKKAEDALREERDSLERLVEERTAALVKKEEHFRSLVESTNDWIWSIGADSRYFYVSPQVKDFLGFELDEILGKTPFDFMPQQEADRVKGIFQEISDARRPFRGLENINIRKDGEAVILETSGVPIFDAAGNFGGYHGVDRDITERKQAEEELRESEGKYRTIFENIQDVYYEANIDGTILEISPSVKNVSQYNRNELVGKSLYDIYTNPKDRDEFLKLIFDKGKVSDFKITLTDRDGSQLPCSISTLLIRDERGNPIKLVGSLRDISERERADNERKRLEAQLLQAQKMESIGNLAGGIAHDFNNILASVIGFTELSLDEVEKGTHIEDNLQEIYTAGKRAKDLVRQILAFARKSEEELKPIPVDTIATEVLKFIRSSIPSTIEIKQTIESDSLIMGNATQVHQILMNLFTNAAHAMEDKGGILEFSLKDIVMDRGVNRENPDLKPGNYIEIKVSDTGAGIAPEIIGLIFDPYFTTKGPGEGTGMGLAMVHGIIESYGGKISVHSKQGQGTLFTIFLPVTRKRHEHHPYQSEELPTGTERILFLDDEALIAKMGSQVLERLGYAVTTRTSSVEAMKLFRTRPNDFDLVITDMTMPNMTGDKLAVEIIKIRPDIPVILCTGYSKKISSENASEIGIRAFAYKPIVKSDLAKTVRKVLDEAKGSAQE